MAGNPYMTPKLFAFLRDLRKNNTREWFDENRPRYEGHAREPLLGFIEDFSEYLNDISCHFVADTRKVGGSLFRIHRDVRFSRDKSPYKTHAGVHFRHESARDVHAPGFYLHLEPSRVFIGAGIWHPDSSALRMIRGGIVDRPDEWVKASQGAAFAKAFKLEGNSLKRPPQGIDRDHPLIGDLKRKDFIGTTGRSQRQACAPEFMQDFARTCADATLFMKFLTEAVGLPF